MRHRAPHFVRMFFRLRLRFPVGVAVALAASVVVAPACAGTRSGGSGPSAAGQYADAPLVVSLERTACYGWCPVYRVYVYEDATIEYEGLHFVKRKGVHREQLDPARVDDLRAALETAHFRHLGESYEQGKNPDLPTIITAHPIDGAVKVVRHYLGDEDAPAHLLTLEEAIDQIVEIERFIGTEAEREQLRTSW